MFVLSRYPKLAVFALGCLSALAMPPAAWWFVLFISVPLFYLCLQKAASPKAAFALGWLFGFGYFLCSLSWIGSALLVEGNGYRWAYPLAIAGIPFLLAFYWGAAAWLYKKYAPAHKVFNWVFFSICFAGVECLRGVAFTGFPWNLFAYSWINHLEILQITYLISAYGLTALTWLCASAVAAITSWRKIGSLFPLIVSFIIAGAVVGYGVHRLTQDVSESEGPAHIKIVAGNIPQSQRWQPQKRFESFMTYVDQSYAPPTAQPAKPTLIVWPETTLTQAEYEDPTLNGYLQEMLASYPNGAVLITGALRWDVQNDQDVVYNSMVQIDPSGRVMNIYNKSHLVPFGEYIPFQKYIPLDPVNNFSGFVAGNGAEIFNTPFGGTYAPAICYEIIFPYALIPLHTKKPDYIINATNDAWYEGSAGPDQHFAQAVVRAIEYNVPVVRASNLGVSKTINRFGRVK